MTAHQIVRIPLEQLRPGMYVGNVFNKRGILLYSANTRIENFSQIAALRRQGVISISVNLKKGVGEKELLSGESSVQQDVREIDEHIQIDVFDKETVKKTVEMRKRALDTVYNFMTAARTGRLFSIGSISSTVETIIDSMLEEPDLLLNLCQMKTHSSATYIHSVNVAVLIVGFSSALGYSRSRIREAGIGALMHDIGKVRLPVELLLRQGACTRQEYELIKRHPDIGVSIIKKNGSTVSPSVLKIVAQHHEQLNGGGYPRGINGTAIDEIALVCAIADRYDTLTTQGMYHRLYLPQEALALIFQGADVEYPRLLVEHFAKLLGIYPVGSFVKLESGEMGVIIKNNRDHLLTPIVKILFDENGVRLTTPYIRDLSKTTSNIDSGSRVSGSVDPRTFNVDGDQYYFQL